MAQNIWQKKGGGQNNVGNWAFFMPPRWLFSPTLCLCASVPLYLSSYLVSMLYRIIMPASIRSGCVLALFLSGVVLSGVSGETWIEEKTRQTVAAFTRNSLHNLIDYMDLEGLRKKKMAEISRMKDADFSVEYASVYDVIRQCPPLIKTYGFKPKMTKKEAMAFISGLDRAQCHQIVNMMPDAVLLQQADTMTEVLQDYLR